MVVPSPVFFETAAEFGHWLDAYAATNKELVVGLHKRGSGRSSMTWPESVDEALCRGWIDGVRKRIDDATYQIRFTPHKPTSIWSAVNIAKYEKLLAQGRIAPAGAKAYAQRTAEGSLVYAYEQLETAELSAQELHTFQRHTAAWQYWEIAPPGYRKTVLHRIVSATRPETRAPEPVRSAAPCPAVVTLDVLWIATFAASASVTGNARWPAEPGYF